MPQLFCYKNIYPRETDARIEMIGSINIGLVEIEAELRTVFGGDMEGYSVVISQVLHASENDPKDHYSARLFAKGRRGQYRAGAHFYPQDSGDRAGIRWGKRDDKKRKWKGRKRAQIADRIRKLEL